MTGPAVPPGGEELREAIREVLAQHKQQRRLPGARQGATCACGWDRAIDRPSDGPAWEAHRLWREHLLDVLAVFVLALPAVREALAAQEKVPDRAEVHYAGMQAVREMPSDWYCPRSEAGRSRRDCPECVAEVALDAALAVVYDRRALAGDS